MQDISVRRFRWGAVALAVSLFAVGLPSAAGAADEPGGAAIDELVDVLHEQGLIDDEQRDQILMKHYNEQVKANAAPSVAQGLGEGWEFFGDLRLRNEGFWYSGDETGVERDNRNRFRYRARIGFKKKINDWVKVGMRFASGSDDPRSTNRTIGDDEDFDPDEVFIDRAWAEIKLPEFSGIQTKFEGGRVANPFTWKRGKDFVVWDGDINLEGGSLKSTLPLGENASLFLNTGYYIDDENSTSSDPKVVALQFGAETKLNEEMEAGVRTSGYWWRSLDDDFVERAQEFGNLPSAFDDGDGKARIGEVTAYLGYNGIEDWPILVYGTAIRNFLADDAIIDGRRIDEEDTAWGYGLEVGSAKKWVKLGAGYFNVEANSVISLFTDSDLFDGFTNRRGWVVYGSRQLAKGTQLNVTLFNSDSIRNSGSFSGCRDDEAGCGPFTSSVEDADRTRLQTDIVFKF
jgi:hypothetical protein